MHEYQRQRTVYISARFKTNPTATAANKNLKVSAALEIRILSSDFGILFQVIIKSTQHDVTFQNATFSQTSNIEYCTECFRQR